MLSQPQWGRLWGEKLFKKYEKFKSLVFQLWLLKKKRPRSLLFYTSREKKTKPQERNA